MKLWNAFIAEFEVGADYRLEARCSTFVKRHHQDLIKNGLRMEFLSHLHHLHEIQLLMPAALKRCMETLDGFVAKTAANK